MNSETPRQHQSSVQDEIDTLIQSMVMTYDTKLLGVLLLTRGAELLRAVHSAQLWRVEDVRAVVDAVTKDIYEPLDAKDIPRVETIGTMSSRPN